MKITKVFFIGLGLILFSPIFSFSATINVPDDQPTIQAGIDITTNGDTVLVSSGVYIEALQYPNHRTIVRSVSGAENTFLKHPGGEISLVTAMDSDSGSTLEGFSIQNVISGTILCHIQGNTNHFFIKNNMFLNNDIFEIIRGTDNVTLHILNNIFHNPDMTGNAIVATGPGCSFINNTIDGGERGIAIYGANSKVLNNIVVNLNWYSIGGAHATAIVDYNNFWNNGENRDPGANGISLDPLFIDAAYNSFYLRQSSPCIDAGDPDPQYNDPDGSRNDMGALPYGTFNMLLPVASNINFGTDAIGYLVLTLTPHIYWSYYDTAITTQSGYELEIGSDNDWSVAEMWATGVVASPDTSILYSGLPLADRTSYFLRIRLSDGVQWGDWRMGEFTTSVPITIHVPGDQPDIQAGIDAAVNGDTILVADGTYTGEGNRDIDFHDKVIVVMSENGPEYTVIDCQAGISDQHRGFIFNQSEDSLSVLNGFSIINAYTEGKGGGIICQLTSPSIINCIIAGNYATDGGGIACDGSGSNPIIEKCLFIDNTVEYGGGGVYCRSASPAILNCTFAHNTGVMADYGGGIFIDIGSPIIKNCIIAYNLNGGGINCWQSASPIITYSNLYENEGGNYLGFGDQTGINGNISEPPLFRDIAGNDYTLLPISPCIDTGDPDPQYNDPDGTRSDMGALYFPQEPYYGPVWHVDVVGSDEHGNGSEVNPFATIQHAIDMSENDDTVLVADGTYTGDGNRDITTDGKSIVITSENGPENTIIDAQNSGDGFHMEETGDDSTTIIEGFTISNCEQGIDLYASTPRLRNLVFAGNSIGIYSLGSGNKLIIENCLFDNGIFGDNVALIEISNCNFDGNGTAIYLLNHGADECLIDSCNFNGYTTAVQGGFTLTNSIIQNGDNGILSSNGYWHDAIVVNCIFENLSGVVIDVTSKSEVTVSNSIIHDNHGEIANCEGGEQDEASLIFNQCRMINNTGGINIGNYTHLFELNNCLYANNGGSIYHSGGPSSGDIDIADCTISSIPDDALRIDGYGELNIARTIISNNDGIGIYYSDLTPDGHTIICSDIYNNAGGNYGGIPDQTGQNGNISSDPLFCDTAGGNYHIAINSPCAPGYNDCGELIGMYDAECGITVDTAMIIDESKDNVASHTPTIAWSYGDLEALPQNSFEIAVGTDSDWEYAEMWNPAPFETADTFIDYDGSALMDGDTYYYRLRLNNGTFWSDWFEDMFRMNSMPSIPVNTSPIDNFEVAEFMPTLYAQNSSDAEDDVLTYDFMVLLDTIFGEPEIYLGENITEDMDSTGCQVNEPLHENWKYWWRSRAYDQYEYSDWSEYESFWINTVEESPLPFQALLPPVEPDTIIFNMLPQFHWSVSGDTDPFDSVYYRLSIAIDSNFTYVNTIDSIWDTLFALSDSLDFGTQFWWKVRAIDNTELYTNSDNSLSFKTWMLGDANADWNVNLTDILFLIGCVYTEGECPEPLFTGDVTGDCNVNLSDILHLISYLYADPPGPAPKIGCE